MDGENVLELALLTTVEIDFTLTAAGRDVAYLSQEQSTNLPCVLRLTNASAADLMLHASQAGGADTRLVVSFGDLATYPHADLTADVATGARSLPVTNITGWAAGGEMTLAVLRDGTQTEAIAVTGASPSPDGTRMLPVAEPTQYAHGKGTRIAGGVGALKIQSDCWTPTFSDEGGSPAWILTLTNDVPVDAGCSVEVMSVSNLLVEGRPRISGVTVDYTLGRLASGSLTAWLRVTDPPPPAHRDHLDDLIITFTPYLSTVWVTAEGDPDVPYALEFTLGNGSLDRPLADPDAGSTQPIFYVFFNYGTGGNTLTTAARAARARLKWIDGEQWGYENADEQMAIPFWTLKPKPDLLKARASVTFRLEGLVTHCPPEMRSHPGAPAAMFLVYTGVRGVKDGVIPLAVGKAPARRAIVHFAAWPPIVNIGDPVRLSWQTVAVPRLELSFLDEHENTQTIGTDLPSNADGYIVSARARRADTQYFLTGFERGPARLTDPATALVTNAFPMLDALSATVPVHAGDVPSLTWRARNADAITTMALDSKDAVSGITPSKSNAIPIARTTLAAPWYADQQVVTVASTDGFPVEDVFDVMIDREVVNVFARRGSSAWTVQHRGSPKPYAGGTTVAPIGMTHTVSPTAGVRPGQSYAAWAWSNDVASAPLGADIPIVPRIIDFQAPAVVEAGTPFTLQWGLDEVVLLRSDVSINNGVSISAGAQSATTQITRATTFTLTARSRPWNQGEQRSARVAVRRETILAAGTSPFCLWLPSRRDKLYALTRDTCQLIVIDLAKCEVTRMIPLPRRLPSWRLQGFGVSDSGSHPLGVVVSQGSGSSGGVQTTAYDLDVDTDSLSPSDWPTSRVYRWVRHPTGLLPNGVAVEPPFLPTADGLKQSGMNTWYQVEPGGSRGGVRITTFDF